MISEIENTSTKLSYFRQTLPIYKYRSEIISRVIYFKNPTNIFKDLK